MERRVIIAGSRNLNDFCFLKNSVEEYLASHTDLPVAIISGGARGADRLGEKYAKENNIKLYVMPAKWDKLGKSAGYIRNVEMAQFASEGQNKGVLLAFWDRKSKGTQRMIKTAQKK